MRRALKLLAVVIAAVVVGLAVYVTWAWDRVWDVPEPDLHASTDPAVIARGEYLVAGPAHCASCHLASVEEYVAWMAGGGELPPLAGGSPLPLGPLGVLYAGNLTPDTGTGIGRYTDPRIARMIRHGVRPDGRASVPPLMPFGDMSDDDVVAVLSYLRSRPAVRREVPVNEWTLLGKVMKSFVAAAQPRLDAHPPATAPASAPTIERGRYLATSVADCVGCHTAFNQLTGAPTGPAYSGGNAMEPTLAPGVDRARWFRPPNLTPIAGSALRRFPDRATFVARFKVGGRKFDGSPMPWEAFGRMHEEDIGALYEFLHSLPPSGAPSPEDPTVPQP